MVDLLLFCMACIGLTSIILEGDIFAPVRYVLKKILPSKLYEVFECHQCMGTWVGFLVGYWLLGQDWKTVLCCGFASSFLCATYHRIFNVFLRDVLTDFLLSHTTLTLKTPDEEQDG